MSGYISTTEQNNRSSVKDLGMGCGILQKGIRDICEKRDLDEVKEQRTGFIKQHIFRDLGHLTSDITR